MLIEVGQKYINAIGEIIPIFRKIEGLDFPFEDDIERAYKENGKFTTIPNHNHKWDLICLVDESLLKQYEANEITQKEFIAKHIELYTGEKL